VGMGIKKLKEKLWFWWRYRYQCPILTRKRHNFIMVAAVKNATFQSNKTIEEKEAILDDLLPRLFKVTVQETPRFLDRPTYMIQIPFNTQMLYECFMHGDSQKAIEYLARRMSFEFEREIRTINFARFR
jgi:hypothetical protein